MTAPEREGTRSGNPEGSESLWATRVYPKSSESMAEIPDASVRAA